MPTLFISHSSQDNAAAADVVDRLRRQGFDSLFLDFDPADGIPAGRNWEQELYGQLNGCNAVVLLCSAASMASDWCFAEITLARSMGKHLFPVVISPCELRPILRDTQYVDLTGDAESGFERLWRGLRAAGLDPKDTLVWDAARPPFPGLSAFQSEDAGVFFGRDDEVRQCLDTLEQMRRFGGDRILIIIGASGSGKSSLMRAGVLPKLRRMPSWLAFEPMQPRRQPTRELASVLSPALESGAGTGDPQALRAALEGPNGARELLDCAHSLQQVGGRPDATGLIVIDQLEEVVTLTDEHMAAGFMGLLEEALATGDGELMCLATLRSDYLGELQTRPFGRELAFRQQILAAMSPDRFTEVITKPAEVANIEVEPGLVARMAQDARGTDALPLLAFTLHRLWRDFGGDRRLTLAEYTDRIGGIEGSIQQAVKDVLASFDISPALHADLRRAFTKLVRVSEEGLYAKRPVAWDELPPSVHPVLEGFVEARLLVSGHEERAGLQGDEERAESQGDEERPARDIRTLEVAHDALFRSWDELRQWLQQDREFLLWRQRIERARIAWLARPKDEGLLLRGGPLAEAQRWLREKPAEVDASSREFIQASRARARRSAWLRYGAAAIILAILAGAGVLAKINYDQRQEAVQNRVQGYWNLALAARDGEGDILKAAHYLAAVADLTAEAGDRDNALVGLGLLTGGLELESAFGLPAVPEAVRVDRATELAVVWDGGGKVRLWDLRSGDVLASVTHPDGVSDARFVAGRRILSWGKADMLLWGPEMNAPVTLSRGAEISGAVTDPSGTKVFSWRADQTAAIQSVETAEETLRLENTGQILGALFLRQGTRVLTWSGDARLQLRDVSDGEPVADWENPCVPQGATVDDDEALLLVWCDDRLSMRGLAQSAEPRSWRAPNRIDGAALSTATGTVAAWSLGAGRIWLWNMRAGAAPALPRHMLETDGAIYRVTMTPDGGKLVTAGADGWITVWDVESGFQLARAQQGPSSGGVLRLEISQDGTRVLSWDPMSGARLWDAGTLMPLGLPLRNPAETAGAAFIDEDEGIVTWGDEANVRVWRRQAGAELTAPWPVSDLPEARRTVASPGSMTVDSVAEGAVTGLDGYITIDNTQQARLLARGSVARALWTAGQGPAASPPLYLGERILGGKLEAGSSRVVLWGPSTLRLWDSGYGRPLSPVLRSDVLFPEVGSLEQGLVTQDRDSGQARIWRWEAPAIRAGNTSKAWLESISGSRLTEAGLVKVLSTAEWCRIMLQDRPRSLPPSCERRPDLNPL